MAPWSGHVRAGRSRHIGPGLLGATEILVLGALAAFLVLWVIPSAFSIESDCIGAFGFERTAGDAYVAASVVVGTFGWLAVAVGAIYARIVESSRLSVLLPIAWFAIFVGGFLVGAALLGPELCPV